MKKKTIIYKLGNRVVYGQDFRIMTGAPAGIEFEVDKLTKTGCWLKAPGYGGKPYGNGRIYISYGAQYT